MPLIRHYRLMSAMFAVDIARLFSPCRRFIITRGARADVRAFIYAFDMPYAQDSGADERAAPFCYERAAARFCRLLAYRCFTRRPAYDKTCRRRAERCRVRLTLTTTQTNWYTITNARAYARYCHQHYAILMLPPRRCLMRHAD